MKKERYESFIRESNRLQELAKKLAGGCKVFSEGGLLQGEDNDEVIDLQTRLYDIGRDISTVLEQLEAVKTEEEIDAVSIVGETFWRDEISKYGERLQGAEEHYSVIMQRIHKQKYFAITHEQEEEMYLSQSGCKYTIDEIARYVEFHGIFHDFKSKDQSVYKPLRLFSSQDIENLLTHPEIKTAVMKFPNAEVFLEYASHISEETFNKMHDLAQASQFMEDPVAPMLPNELGEAMGRQLIALYEHLTRDGKEAEGERFALTMLTSYKHPMAPHDKTFKPLTDYWMKRGENKGVIEDLRRFYKDKHCGAGFNTEFCKLYGLVKSHNEVKKILDKQAGHSPEVETFKKV